MCEFHSTLFIPYKYGAWHVQPAVKASCNAAQKKAEKREKAEMNRANMK